MVIKVSNLKRVNNRLVGYFKVNDHDFDKKPLSNSAAKGTFDQMPNEYFYRKFRKATGLKWQEDFGYMIISDQEVSELIEGYQKKRDFCEKQRNLLTILSTSK